MTVSFSQLIAETTESAVYSTLRTAGNIVGLDFEALPDNDLMRTLIKSVIPRGIFVTFGQYISTLARGGFLEFALDGPWLEALGEQLYGVERIRQTFATTTVTFSNASDSPYTFTAEQVIVKNTVTGKTYKSAGFSIGAVGEVNDTVSVAVIAVEPGSQSNADIGQIAALVTTFDGLTVTNPDRARANDLERAEDYIRRCKAAPVAVSANGPKGAYELFATSATRPDGTAIGVTRVRVNSDDPFSAVTVFLADVDGPITSDDAALVNDVLLANVVGHGVDYGGAAPADAVDVAVTYVATAVVTAGLSADDIKDRVEEALADLFSRWPIGGHSGNLYQSKIRSTIEQIGTVFGVPDLFVDVQVSAPASNVPLDVNEVPVLGVVTGTIGFI